MHIAANPDEPAARSAPAADSSAAGTVRFAGSSEDVPELVDAQDAYCGWCGDPIVDPVDCEHCEQPGCRSGLLCDSCVFTCICGGSFCESCSPSHVCYSSNRAALDVGSPGEDRAGTDSPSLSGTVGMTGGEQRPGGLDRGRPSASHSARRQAGTDGRDTGSAPSRTPPVPPWRSNESTDRPQLHPKRRNKPRRPCQCPCRCRRQPGERIKCLVCEKLIGPGCCLIQEYDRDLDGTRTGLCHVCYVQPSDGEGLPPNASGGSSFPSPTAEPDAEPDSEDTRPSGSSGRPSGVRHSPSASLSPASSAAGYPIERAITAFSLVIQFMNKAIVQYRREYQEACEH